MLFAVSHLLVILLKDGVRDQLSAGHGTPAVIDFRVALSMGKFTILSALGDEFSLG